MEKWRKEGRTGPGPLAPRYKNRRDRNKVRRGKPVGNNNPNPYGGGNSNPGGPGGRRGKIPRGGSSGGKKKGCCSYVEAGKAITRLEFRLAVRYVRMDIKARLGVLA
jgi:hypothetical protein